jgi:hypothetical protein
MAFFCCSSEVGRDLQDKPPRRAPWPTATGLPRRSGSSRSFAHARQHTELEHKKNRRRSANRLRRTPPQGAGVAPPEPRRCPPADAVLTCQNASRTADHVRYLRRLDVGPVPDNFTSHPEPRSLLPVPTLSRSTFDKTPQQRGLHRYVRNRQGERYETRFRVAGSLSSK